MTCLAIPKQSQDKRSLATLIYYPKEKIELVKNREEDMEKLV